MGLYHEFTILDSNMNVMNIKYCKENMEVSMSDVLFCYMNDSFEWIKGKWNGMKEKQGLNYYGYTVLERQEIVKLQHIMEGWIKLFEQAPDTFCLTGFYMEDGRYERNQMKKKELIQELRMLVHLCKKAQKKDGKILHYGI